LSFVSHGNDTTGVTSGAGLFTLNEHLSSSPVLVGFVLLDVLFSVWCFVDRCLSFCPFVLFLLGIVWSDLWFTDSDYPFGISSSCSCGIRNIFNFRFTV